MLTCTSPDRTHIACFSSGQGPSLVLIHGTGADNTRWARILPEFEKRFTVYAVDRRGRGSSGDSEVYALEREFEDLAAIIKVVPGPVFLLGHSFGAICSIEVSLSMQNIARMVLYEPPIPVGGPICPPDLVDHMLTLSDEGQREEVLITFFRDIVRMSEIEISQARSLATWPTRVAAAHTIPRELREVNKYVFKPARFSAVAAPVLLLLGGDSPDFLTRGTNAVHAAIPSSRVTTMPGQRHVAMDTAPGHFLRELIAFFNG